MTKVAICVPSPDSWKAEFGQDLIGMVAQFVSHPDLQDVAMNFVSAIGGLLLKNRTLMAKSALSIGATHLLWLDCEMRFPPDTLVRLLAHKKPIVGVNARVRNAPYHFTAGRGLEADNIERVKTFETSTGLEAVDWVGFAAVLIEAQVFEKSEEPWFMFAHEDSRWIGEDTYFCRKARQAGFQPYVDHDLSKEVRSISTIEIWFNSLSDKMDLLASDPAVGHA